MTIQAYADLLANQKILLYPTDTIWGLGGDATSEAVVDRIFDIKERPAHKSLIILVKDIEMIQRYTDVDLEIIQDTILQTLHPTTFVVSKVKGLAKSAIAQDGTIGFRIPNHAFCQSLLTLFNKPIISTSANISGIPTPLTFDLIDEAIKNNVDAIVDAQYDTSEYHQPSRVLRILADGDFETIRA
ncbi:MAG: threonylcarbamoyl-AMP synthase [Chitinophagales bacterium]|nr:threonylcarbamoyl-AMP synthase [Chitinophagales bacterium]